MILDLEKRIDKIVGEKLGIPMGNVYPFTSLSNFDLDSLDYVEILMCLEEEFEITINKEDAVNIKCFQDVYDMVGKYI